MRATGYDGDGGCVEEHGAQARHIAWLTAPVFLPAVSISVSGVVAELPAIPFYFSDAVVPPALDVATVEERAGVGLAGSDSDGGCVEEHGTQARHLARHVALVVGAVVAEPPPATLESGTTFKETYVPQRNFTPTCPPALDVATVEKRAGMVIADRDCDGGCVKVHGAQARHLARCVALAVGAVVAELPVFVPPPALDTAIVEDRAGVHAAGRQLGGVA